MALLGLAASLNACGSDQDVPPVAQDGGSDGTTPPVTGDDSGSSSDATLTDASAPNACADASADADIDCTGKCGPVKDPCTGKVKACGGCANAVGADGGDGGVQVCDLSTNTCTTPKTTCADLGAECGTIKNSCGDYLDCPDTNPKGCPTGKECDPDTHKCRDCQPVTCADLGIECGAAWLGCGEDTPSNYTDCGGCAPAADGGARKCNAVFHVCEPACVPKSAKELCDDAKAKKGLECGIISDGCGGTVNCDAVPGYGCQNGESCGVRGIANRCDPKSTPDECKALGKNCGTIKSACTGLTIKCGDCPNGEVCNPNGVCGPPCTPKTCADFTQYQCGTFDDSCGGTVTCGTCTNGVCNNTTHTCCATNTCSGTYAGECGSGLANGCGGSITCGCANGTSCTADGGAAPAPPSGTPGECCTPKTAASYAGKCGTNLPNGCGQNNVNVSCPNGGFCVNNQNGAPDVAPPNGVAGTCCTNTATCTGQPAGSCAPVQNTCRPPGTTISCNGVCTNGQTCNNNTCCTRPTCSGGGGEGGECNVTKPANGCGSDLQCNCAGGRTCWCTDHQCVAGTDGPGVCKSALTCSSAAYAGKCGTGLDNGIGGVISCGCGNGKVCSTTTPGQLGTCVCSNGLGAPYTCQNVPNGPNTGGDKCGSFSDGCGGSFSCNCPNGQTCNTVANPNVCCTAATCPAPGIGSACGTLSNNCGGTISCGCPSGAANANFKCTNGTCQCTPDTCRGRTGPQPDLCGGTLQCGG